MWIKLLHCILSFDSEILHQNAKNGKWKGDNSQWRFAEFCLLQDALQKAEGGR